MDGELDEFTESKLRELSEVSVRRGQTQKVLANHVGREALLTKTLRSHYSGQHLMVLISISKDNFGCVVKDAL